MAISYPLTIPSYPAPAGMKLTQQSLVSLSQSQFTGTQQVQEWPGEWWEAEFSLPSVLGEFSGAWRGFLGALRGISGTFLMGPGGLGLPYGTAGNYTNMLRRAVHLGDAAYWTITQTGGADLPTAADAPLLPDPFGGPSSSILVFPTTGDFMSVSISQQVSAIISGQTLTASIYLRADVPGFVDLVLQSQTTSFTQSCAVGPDWTQWAVQGQFPDTDARSVSFVLSQGADVGGQTILAYGAQLQRSLDVNPFERAVEPSVVTPISGSKTLDTTGWPNSETILKAGDYFQIGQRLYMTLTDATTDSSGNVTFDIFPRLRDGANNADLIYWIDPVGTWRLQENPRSWGIQPGLIHDISGIKCREAF